MKEIKMILNLGSIKIPINAATKTFGILAKRGAGKTYTGGVMAEEFFANNIPFVVFDPIDVWWGLRIDKDGKGKGLPVVVFGKEHADIELNRDMGPRIAKAVVRDNVSCVISTFGMPKKAQRHLIAEFAEELLNINNTPRHVLIEEAHEFVPQRVIGAMGTVFNAVNNLVVMGRNRGIGVTLLNQRAATVNKDVLTQIDTLIAMRNVGPHDRKALREWVEVHAAEGNFEKFINSLPSLPTGEGWLWSPEFLGKFEKIKIRQRRTFHPDREKIGKKFIVPQIEQIDIQEFVSHFNADIEENESEETKKSTKRIKQEVKAEAQKIIELRNRYESEILKKDVRIRNLEDTIRNVQRAIGGMMINESSSINILTNQTNSATIDMWQSKLGKSGASRIFKFLATNSPKIFTKQQIGLAVGLKSTTGSFATYMSKLKSNYLIIKEGEGYRLNPEL